VGGDFNIVCFPTKRLGVEAFTPAMHNFFDFISAHGLVDIPLAGDNFRVILILLRSLELIDSYI
jgi:hypothetical protein